MFHNLEQLQSYYNNNDQEGIQNQFDSLEKRIQNMQKGDNTLKEKVLNNRGVLQEDQQFGQFQYQNSAESSNLEEQFSNNDEENEHQDQYYDPYNGQQGDNVSMNQFLEQKNNNNQHLNQKQYYIAPSYKNPASQIQLKQNNSQIKQESKANQSLRYPNKLTYAQMNQNRSNIQYKQQGNISDANTKHNKQLSNQHQTYIIQKEQDENNPFADNVIDPGIEESSHGMKRSQSQAKMGIVPSKKQQLLYKQCQYPEASITNQQQQDDSQLTQQVVCQDEQDLQLVKNKLRTIFTFYASFGDRINVNYLKSNKFHKMMIDAQLRDTCLLTQSKLDLMFVKENKHKPNMDFQTFLNLLAQIAQLKYPQSRRQNGSENCSRMADSLNQLLVNHFLPLYDNIMAETDLGEDEHKFKEEIDELSLQVLKDVSHILVKIYMAYFPWEPNSAISNFASLRQRSEGALFVFLKEYDICPSLLTKSSAFLLLSEVLDTDTLDLCRNQKQIDLTPYIGQDMGCALTFSRFCIYLIRISCICYNNVQSQTHQKGNDQQDEVIQTCEEQMSKAEMFAFLLERMELSQGFLNLEKKIHVPHNSGTSLIIRKKLQNQLKSESQWSQYNAEKQQQIQQQYLQQSGQLKKSQQSIYKTLQSENNQRESQQSQIDTKSITDRNIQNEMTLASSTSPRGTNYSRSRSEVNMKKIQNNQLDQQSQQMQYVQQILTERSGLSPINRVWEETVGITKQQQTMKRNKSQNFFQQKSQLQEVYQMNNLKYFKNIAELTKISPEILVIIDQNAEALVKIFQSYCSFGDPLNTSKMKSAKFTKLLRECKLISDNPNQSSIGLYDNFASNNQQQQLTSEQLKRELYPGDVDIIFVKVKSKKLITEESSSNQQQSYDKGMKSPYKNSAVNAKNNNYFEFEHFLQALEFIACKLFAEYSIQQAFEILLQNHILYYNSESVESAKSNSGQHVQMLLGILKDEEVVELLRIVHKSIVKFYQFYANPNGLINFDQFAKFCKDFGIFPEIIPKAKLLKIFVTLSSIFSSTEMQQIQSSKQNTQRSHQTHLSLAGGVNQGVNKINSNSNRMPSQQNKGHFDVMDQHLFVEALSLCAFEIPFSEPQPSNIEKICYLLERMSQSQGPKLISQQTGINRLNKGGTQWDILSQIRKKYPDLYVSSRNGQEKIYNESKPSFDQLMKQNINYNQ